MNVVLLLQFGKNCSGEIAVLPTSINYQSSVIVGGACTDTHTHSNVHVPVFYMTTALMARFAADI